VQRIDLPPACRVTTCLENLENLEMSGNLKHVREMSRKKILSGKSVPKVFITGWIFAFIWVFSIIHGDFILCNYYEVFWNLIVWSFTYTSNTGMLWVPLDMGMSATHCQGNVGNFIVSGEWSPCACASCAMPIADESNYSAASMLYAHCADRHTSLSTHIPFQSSRLYSL